MVNKLIAFEATSLAHQAGSSPALNMVMLGALVQSGVVPLPQERFVQAIKETTKKQFVDINLNAFEMGMQAYAKESAQKEIEV